MPEQKIDLNRAAPDQLMTIVGVDEALATKIFAYRKQRGPFKTFADLEALGPIPADTMEELRTRGHIAVDPVAAERASQAGPFELRSTAFENGGEIPVRFTCDGENLAPPLEWSGAPPETRSFALIVEDPDAPSGVFRHWAVYNIAAGRTLLPEATGQEAATEPLGYGINDFGKARYDGPCPPQGHGVHHYHFRLAALNVQTLNVPLRASVADVWKTAEPHILAEAELTGIYRR